MEDAKKRVWFWSNNLDGTYGGAYINGLLFYNGSKIDYLEFGPPVDNMAIGIMANKDASHCWVGMLTNGLYQMDLETFGFTPVPEPTFRAFDSLYGIFSVGPDWYFANGANTMAGPTQLAGDLWRWTPDKAERILTGLDRSIDYARMLSRPFLATAEGLWIGSPYGGWFVPVKGGAPIPLDWKIGYPATRVDFIFKVKDGGILLGAFGNGSVQFASMAKQQAIPATGRLKTENIYASYRLAADSRRHLWHVDPRSSRGRVLKEWDGELWKEHPIPAEMNLPNGQELLPDSRSRLWWMEPNPPSRVVIYDPLSTNWSKFDSLKAALQTVAGKPENLPSGSERYGQVTTASDGRLAFYETYAQRLHYFDGKAWTNWSAAEVKENSYEYGPANVFFSSQGRLAFSQRNTTRELGDKGWKTASYSPPLENSDRFKYNLSSAIYDPEFRQTYAVTNRNITNPVWDNDGTVWFAADQQLYRAIPGLCVAQFNAEEWHPFIGVHSVMQALVDPKGKIFLKSPYASYGDFYLLEPSDALPHTKIDLKRIAEDSVEATFSAQPASRCWFRWKLDQGPWSKPSMATALRLEDLPSGKHLLLASAINRDLSSDPTPAEAPFVVNLDPGKQIASHIEKLFSGSSSEREKAVTALARQPALALPALQSARSRANADQRWWIDAAIQQVEDSGRKTRKL
jgi:hypothetical protein